MNNKMSAYFSSYDVYALPAHCTCRLLEHLGETFVIFPLYLGLEALLP